MPAGVYRPRRPTASPLFWLLTNHFDGFRGRYEDHFERAHCRWRRAMHAAPFAQIEEVRLRTHDVADAELEMDVAEAVAAAKQVGSAGNPR